MGRVLCAFRNEVYECGSLSRAVDGAARSRVLVVNGVYSLFARVLDYPAAEIFADVAGLVAQLDEGNPEAAQSLRKFESELGGMTLGALQELYTSTFDMRPDRTTNLGCHLFGENLRRNLFMAQLKGRMEARLIPLGCELPDHLSLVLRLLAVEESEDEAQTLSRDCVTPAVTHILSTFQDGGSGNPYAHALQALLEALDPGGVVKGSSGSGDIGGA